MNPKSPTLWRILTTDYLSFLLLIIPPIYFILGVILSFQDPAVIKFIPYDVLIIAVLGPIIFWRYRFIQGTFEDGMQTPGIIQDLDFFRDRGRIVYRYTYNGEEYVSANAIMKTRITKNLQIGQKVTVFCDREKPKKAFIYEIYC